MGKRISLFNSEEPEPLDDDVNLALRELAGWPLQTKHHGATKSRHRTLVIQRDALGRVTGSIEQLDEDEHEEYSETWGK
ncbi:hypothetical protein E3T26_08565 [Cryobacterium sp. TMT1-21]|uniref:hypothetical protein n=1 Tax=Cryobacterium sp. TMT1-21 TaxID=1259234 RepID=UPI00106D382B|nr:hypothetical protein [Cryobacterium sp. TMT1-21]TFD14166.1 hypothetical protein E3T26_08565 [Cryobacterium sp. TMT1-21]